VLRVLNEPTAAALAYGLALGTEERIAVFDLGGGTFDLTILDLASNVFEVVATAGDSMLGGDDLDRAIALRMASECAKAFRFDPRADTAMFSRLLLAAEEVKRTLTVESETRIEVPGLEREPGAPPLTLGFSLSRAQLEQLAQPLLDRTVRVCERALATAQLTTKQVDRVILVGGSTRSPFVAQRVAAFFEKEPYVSLDPDRVVALGAALQAASLDRGRSKRSSVAKVGLRPIAKAPSSPPNLLADSSSNVALPSNPSLPAIDSIFATGDAPSSGPARMPSRVEFGELDLPAALPMPGLPAVDPAAPPLAPAPFGAVGGSRIPTLSGLPAMSAETIAMLQGGDERLRVQGKLPLLVDVTPLGLAIETAGGYAQFLVAANTPVPCDRTMRFATAADQQTSVAVRVAQGDAQRFDGNTLLGEVTLSGLRAASRGLVQVDVTFAIDASGILNVSAKDVETGLETSSQIRLLGTRDDKADLAEMAARQERAVEGRTR
jgi:molecular chaperone DnaK